MELCYLWRTCVSQASCKCIFCCTGTFTHPLYLMIRSKYPLAAVDRLCCVFGKDLLMGYDIGCTFRGTALRSPLVGDLVRESNLSFVVGSFHGYAHNRKCQLTNHPLNVEGAGLESFEQNEQLFSSTNSVARTTRHSSRFHRHQLLALHLTGWDFGRRCNIGESAHTIIQS
jgi:hypothetical protein